MKIHYDIIPLYEARIYLSDRFSKNRVRERLADIQKKSASMNNEYYALLERISAFQDELDELFKPDEVMLKYFTPIELNRNVSDALTITIGGMLLALPGDLQAPFGFDNLIETYMQWPHDFLIEHFYTNSLSPFFADRDEDKGMLGFVAAADKILAKPEEKWALVDAISNPFPHLEKLRNLVCAVANEIERISLSIKDELKRAIEEIKGFGDPSAILNNLLRMNMQDSEIKWTEYYQSIFAFNRVCFAPSTHYFTSTIEHGGKETPLGDPNVLLIVGVYIAALVRKNAKIDGPSSHLYLLKLISDPMRFNVLCDMCDHYTYGLELAEKYKTTRSAMYYHLEKLVSNGLIDLKSSEYRMLYTMNKRNVYSKLNALRDYLTNGWKPEDEE